MDIKKDLQNLIKKYTKKDIDLEVPPDPSFGDYALPCFKLDKDANKIAKELARKIKAKFIEKIEIKGPYLNFFINKKILTENILNNILKNKNYGSSKIGKGEKILIEHTSINPNASPHVGRARNALIGDALVRIYKFQDYKVEVHYFVNDVGKQISMLVLACKGKKVNFNDLLKIYIDINKKVKENPKIEEEVLDLLNHLERGNKKIKDAFKKTVRVCINGQREILKKLGIEYDFFDYESEYLWHKQTEKVLEKLEKTGRLYIDQEGRYVLDQQGYNLAMKSPVLVLTRADRTSLYPLRDIAYTIDKLKRAKENIVVLGEEQKLYFQQIKAALDLLKLKAPKVVHYSFVLLKQKGIKEKMSTREGTVVLLEDFMNEIIKKAEEELKKRKNENKKLAEIIGLGALKFGILKINNEKNVIFDFEEALNFEGETGPYIQYAHARAHSILKKARKVKKANLSLLKEKGEIELVKRLGDFSNVVLEATNSLKPSLIANYIYDVAKTFNNFYRDCQVLNAENKELMKARLILVKATTIVLKNGLNLLGIEAPEKM